MTSKELKTTQETLESIIVSEINDPMTDYKKVNLLLKTVKEVDKLRRETWNNEKFGVYEQIVDEAFNSDDIPF